MEEYRNDLLKYFIQYNNTNSEAIPMVDVSLQDKSSGKFMEQLKSLINLLLHFRYMFMYVKKHMEFKLKSSLSEDLFEDLDFCSEQYSLLINSSIFFDFIRKREQFYIENMDSFHSFKRDCDGGGLLSLSTFNNFIDQNASSIVDDIITVPDLHLVEQSGPTNRSNQSGTNLQPGGIYSSGEISGTASQAQTTPEITCGSQQTSSYHNLQQQQTNSSAFDVDSNMMNKDLYANLLFETAFPMTSNNQMLVSNQQKPSINDKRTISCSQQQKRPRTSSTITPIVSKSESELRIAVCSTNQKNPQEQLTCTDNGEKSSSPERSQDYTTPELLQVEYHCTYNGCRFRSKSLIQVKEHEERRHIQQLQTCSYDGCSAVFQQKEDLDSHMSRVHLCSKLRCHIEDCQQIFTNVALLRKHIKEDHKPEREGNFICKECGKKFKTRKYLNKHHNRMHNDEWKRKRQKQKKTQKSEKEKSSLKNKRNKKKNNRDSDDSDLTEMEDNETSGTDNDNNDKGEYEPGPSSELVKLRKSNKIFECSLHDCNQKFFEKSKLNQHIRENHRIEYLTCKFCDKLCRSRNSLTNHIWIMHEEGEFKCTFENCDFISKYRKNLLNHKKLRHQRERKCPICGELIVITRFQRHMSGLHKIKNYACSWPDCGKTFADHSALKNHVRIHLNFKRFKCKWPECGYASEQRFTVITHIRVCHFKLPRTKKKQLEMNIAQDDLTQNPYDYLEVCREDICI